MGKVDTGMIHVPGKMKRNGPRFHRVTQNGVQLKTRASSVSGFSILYFQTTDDHGTLKPQKVKPLYFLVLDTPGPGTRQLKDSPYALESAEII